jgi:predicted ABC-type ATPase
LPNLYIIAGCNGAGKTTASFTILPDMLNCKEFVNADSIAAGLSPFNPESVAFEAGRLMLNRIYELLKLGVDFAFETTAVRVTKGGHNIPQDVIERRYYRGIFNLITLFIPVVDTWMIVNSANVIILPIAEGGRGIGNIISNDYIWGVILDQSKVNGSRNLS